MFQLLIFILLNVLIVKPTFGAEECSGDGYFRDPNDCAKLYRCSNGRITHRFNCGEGKVFNDITKMCEDPKYVNCQNTVPIVSSITDTTTTITTSPVYIDHSTITKSIEPLTTSSSIESLTTSAAIKSVTTSVSIESLTTSATIEPLTTTASVEPLTTTVSVEPLTTSVSIEPLTSALTTIPSTTIASSNVTLVNLNSTSSPVPSEIPIVPEEYNNNNTESKVETGVITEPFASKLTSDIISESESRTEEKSSHYSNVTIINEVSNATQSSTIENITEAVITEITSTPTNGTTKILEPTSLVVTVLPVIESTIVNETIPTPGIINESIPNIEEPIIKDNACGFDNTTVKTFENDEFSSENETDSFKIVCYFTNWARYRYGNGKFMPEHINPYLCTHINYAFAILDNETLTLRSADPCTDINNLFYTRIIALKEINRHLKVLMALGGWSDSEGDKYSRLVRNGTARTKFIRETIEFLRKYKFDGLDIDWEFPKCWHADCNAGPDSDREHFAVFVAELREAFNKEINPLLLTAAVSAHRNVIDLAYNVTALSEHLDFVNLMAYDYHTIGDKFALHHSAIYRHPTSPDPSDHYLNINFSIHHWLRKGLPSRKLILGIPFYGRSFELQSPTVNNLGSPVTGVGKPGEYTKEAGYLSYHEICQNIYHKGWAKRIDIYSFSNGNFQFSSGPYAHKGDQWIGYDDRDQIVLKSGLIRDQNLGGAMIWALDLDDFTGDCCKVKNPLLKTLNRELRAYPFDLNFTCP